MAIAKIPFCGFYESLVDEEIRVQDRFLFEDDRGDLRDPDAYEKHLEEVSFAEVRDFVARDYAEWFITEFVNRVAREFPELEAEARRAFEGTEFDHWDSPRYYNFETDHIYISLPPSAHRFLRSLAESKELSADYGGKHCSSFREYVAEALRPRDGFIPFYSNDLDDWPELGEWNSAQNGLLLDFVAYGMGMDDDDDRLDQRYCEDRSEQIMEACYDVVHEWMMETQE